MRLSFDRTGFPLLELAEPGLGVSLWPCAKAQFEAFLAEPDNGLGDLWYEQVLAINPRVSWRDTTPGRLEQLFLTGVYPEEVIAFLRWLGDGFDLATVDEWRAVDDALASAPLDANALARIDSEAAGGIRSHVQRVTRAKTWGALALLRGGVVEWVRDGERFAGLGAPCHSLLPNTYNPSQDLWRPARLRLDYFGFRVVRRRSFEREEDAR